MLPRLRLLLALTLSILISPALASRMPELPREPLALAGLLIPEILVGLLLGFVARLALAAVHAGGSLIAMQSGLSAAAMFDPNEATQDTIPGASLRRRRSPCCSRPASITCCCGRSPRATRPSRSPHAIDPSAAGEPAAPPERRRAATGARIAAPMILSGILVNLALGAMGRMVPSFPIFFLALPVQLLLALVVLELSLPAAMALFGEAFIHGVAWLEPRG